jgi:hypothetical protein
LVDVVFPYVFVFLPLAIFIATVFLLFVVANAGTIDWYARQSGAGSFDAFRWTGADVDELVSTL